MIVFGRYKGMIFKKEEKKEEGKPKQGGGKKKMAVLRLEKDIQAYNEEKIEGVRL